ncbi:hypothetical protein G6F56_008048 [Rhizopus delemar]|nr:hypothetical protein G6F56_008048 [Rhizopus delemar]
MSWSSTLFVSSSDILSTTATSGVKTKARQQTRTPWTSTEDYLLEKGYLKGLSWAMISSRYLPHRSRGCCWGRFKTLRTKASQKKIRNTNEDKILLVSIEKRNRLFKQAWRTVNSRDWKKYGIGSARIGLSHFNQVTIS